MHLNPYFTGAEGDIAKAMSSSKESENKLFILQRYSEMASTDFLLPLEMIISNWSEISLYSMSFL